MAKVSSIGEGTSTTLCSTVGNSSHNDVIVDISKPIISIPNWLKLSKSPIRPKILKSSNFSVLKGLRSKRQEFRMQQSQKLWHPHSKDQAVS